MAEMAERTAQSEGNMFPLFLWDNKTNPTSWHVLSPAERAEMAEMASPSEDNKISFISFISAGQ